MSAPRPAMGAAEPADVVVDFAFGTLVFSIGALDLWLVHPAPGIVGLALSMLYLPHVRRMLSRTMGLRIPRWFRIALGVLVVWFTLGVSDLGDLID